MGGTYGFKKELVIARRGCKVEVSNKGLYNAYVRGATAKMRGDKSCPYSMTGQFGMRYAGMWTDGWNASPEELKVNSVIPGFMSITHKQAIKICHSLSRMVKAERRRKKSAMEESRG